MIETTSLPHEQSGLYQFDINYGEVWRVQYLYINHVKIGFWFVTNKI